MMKTIIKPSLLSSLVSLLSLGGLVLLAPVYAGVKVGDNPTTIGASSLLELESTDKALLVPRVANTAAIASPANGMVIYDLSTQCIKGYANNTWTACWAGGGSTPPPVAGAITALSCTTATHSGTLTSGSTASSVSDSVPYTGGNGGTHSGQTVSSTGVTGLTATLAAGSFATGAGSLTYTITGTPASSGTASFALNIGGQSCTLNRTVAAAGISTVCPVNMGSGVTRNWLCHNLGANNTLDPHTPVVGLQGSYIKWGKTYNMSSLTNNGAAGYAAAPTASNPNNAAIAGWDMTEAPDNAWNSGTEVAPVKTATDPCPSGFRVPTMTEWTALVSNNTNFSTTGSAGWVSNQSPTNYGNMVHIGTASNPKVLSLPMTGFRIETGELTERGFSAPYPSSSVNSSLPRVLSTGEGSVGTNSFWFKFVGYPIRCIAE